MRDGKYGPGCRRRCGGVFAAALLGAPAVALAAEGGAPYPGGPMQAIVAVVIFLVLLVVLRRFAWKPIITQLRHREEHVAETVSRAERREVEAEELLKQYKDKIAEAEREAESLLGKAREAAAAARQELLESAQREAEASAREARREIERARRAALRDLCETTAQLSTEVAGKIIARELGDDDHARLVRESLSDIAERAREDG